MQQKLPPKQRELEKAENELKGLEAQKEVVVQGAREAMRSREDGAEVADELELRGRWLKGVESGLRAMLEVKGTPRDANFGSSDTSRKSCEPAYLTEFAQVKTSLW